MEELYPTRRKTGQAGRGHDQRHPLERTSVAAARKIWSNLEAGGVTGKQM